MLQSPTWTQPSACSALVIHEAQRNISRYSNGSSMSGQTEQRSNTARRKTADQVADARELYPPEPKVLSASISQITDKSKR